MEPDPPDELSEEQLRALLAAERANSFHWRWTAERRLSADRDLVSRPLVRLAMAADRRLRALIARFRRLVSRRSRSSTSAPTSQVPARRWDGSGPARIVITICAPTRRVASGWGDLHLAQGLADALGRVGHSVEIQTMDEADRRDPAEFDLEVVIRGLTRVVSRSAPRRALWIISHPESVTGEECDDADMVLTGSELHATRLRQMTRSPVDVMLQATDPEHFRPEARDEARANDVVIVAKTRGVFRPMVQWALDAGLEPAVHGSGWGRLIDPRLIVTERVPHDDLPAVYASATVVLNDHWDTMRAWGFVSNRIFDAVACGTCVVTDAVPELDTLFCGAAICASNAEEVGAAARRLIDDPSNTQGLAAAGRQAVLDHHTFDHRAAALLSFVSGACTAHHST